MDGIELLKNYVSRETASQAQLARDVDCSESHLSLVLARKRGLSVPLAKKIANATGVPLNTLVAPEVAELMGEAAE